ncbi:MAG: hypothetical protein V7752_10850 [Halopseudomonas sp.]
MDSSQIPEKLQNKLERKLEKAVRAIERRDQHQANIAGKLDQAQQKIDAGKAKAATRIKKLQARRLTVQEKTKARYDSRLSDMITLLNNQNGNTVDTATIEMLINYISNLQI